MKFSSIKEFFYKLQSMCYALLLLPLGILIALYLVPSLWNYSMRIEEEQTVFLLRIAFPIIALVELTTVHLVARMKLKKISKLPSLGDRMDNYVPIAYLRTVSGVTLALLMLAGFYVTADTWFTGYTTAILLIIFLQRPTPTNLSRDLELKGNERELIMKGELV